MPDIVSNSLYQFSQQMKKIFAAILALGMALSLAGCGNRQMIDLTYSYKYAIISLPNGEIVEGKVDSWKDFEDGDQLQITVDGVTYLVHATDAVLITEER